MNIAYPDYGNCGLNVISSILRYFDAPVSHKTLPFLDEILAKKPYRNIVLALFDGMGMDALKNDSAPDSFLNAHIAHELSAVFPSTTTAATTSIECGKSPAEHGWIGWTLYFDEIGKSVDVFINRVQNTKEQAADYHVGQHFMPLDPVFPRIQAAGRAKAVCVSPFSSPAYETLEEIAGAVSTICAEPGRHYIYAYWGEPDHTMHQKGVYADEVKQKIAQVNDTLRTLAANLPDDDTLLLATADHGLIDANHLFVQNSPELSAMLIRPPVIEPRAAAFYVKPECVQAFPAAFWRAFSPNFILMTGQEFMDSGPLGDGPRHPRLSALVGDYVALATGADCIDYSPDGTMLCGVHAGLTRQEMRVPLIVAKE